MVTVRLPCPACGVELPVEAIGVTDYGKVLRLTLDRAALVAHLTVTHPGYVLCDRPYDDSHHDPF